MRDDVGLVLLCGLVPGRDGWEEKGEGMKRAFGGDEVDEAVRDGSARRWLLVDTALESPCVDSP